LSTASTSQTFTCDLDDDRPSPRIQTDNNDPGTHSNSPRYKGIVRSRLGSGSKFTPFTVKGFLVSINKSLTYDIDLQLDEEQTVVLSGAQTSSYSYHDYPTDHLRNPDFTPLSELSAIHGTCFRCRLKGINFTDNDAPIWKVNKITIFAKQLTDRGNGWVTCTVHQIDQYHRLIIDIQVTTTEGELSVKEQLLQYVNNNKDCGGMLSGM